jgi:hypothetical protein
MRPVFVIVRPAHGGVRQCDSTRRATQICLALRRGARSSRRGDGAQTTAVAIGARGEPTRGNENL